MSPRQNG